MANYQITALPGNVIFTPSTGTLDQVVAPREKEWVHVHCITGSVCIQFTSGTTGVNLENSAAVGQLTEWHQEFGGRITWISGSSGSKVQVICT